MVATSHTCSHLRQASTNWWRQIILLPIFHDLTQTAGNKSRFFPSWTIEYKLGATNRTSAHLSHLCQSNTNWWQQIVLLPIIDNGTQIDGNKSYFCHLWQWSTNWWQQTQLLPIVVIRVKKLYFFRFLTVENKLEATSRTSYFYPSLILK